MKTLSFVGTVCRKKQMNDDSGDIRGGIRDGIICSACKASSTAKDFYHLWDEGNAGEEFTLTIVHGLRIEEQWTRPFL